MKKLMGVSKIKIEDITDQYIDKVFYHNNLAGYKEAYPSLFEHYFTFWGDRNAFTKTLTSQEVREKVFLIKHFLPAIEKKLGEYGFEIEHLKIVLLVGQSSTNGHAFLDNDKFVVWIPIELYTTELQVKMFLTHEIIHAIHYKYNRDYYFYSSEEKQNSLRQLITEGVATYITKILMNVSEADALWAGFLTKEGVEDWMNECERNKNEICKKILSREHLRGLFEANKSNDIFNFRAGYYLGLKIITSVVCNKNLSLVELIMLPKKELDNIVKNELQRCIY